MSYMKSLSLAAIVCASAAGSAAAFPIANTGEGYSITVATTGEVVAYYRGNSASYTNLLFLDGHDGVIFNNQTSPLDTPVSLGVFTAGTELKFSLQVTNTGYTFYTGPAERNPDGHAHARVQADWQPGETLVSFEDLFNGPFAFNDLSFSFTNTASAVVPPSEVPVPAAGLLLAGGLGAVGLLRRRKA